MKKIFAVILMLAVAGAAFADVAASGRVRVNFGAEIPFQDGDDPTWIFDPHFRLRFGGGNDAVRFWTQFDANPGGVLTAWRADATVDLGAVSLSIGRNELPWMRLSSVAFLGNNNFGWGSSTSNTVGYITARFMGAYLGLTEAGRISGAYITNDSILPDTYSFFIPGFFVGYDFNADTFSVGGAFAGLITNRPVLLPPSRENIFSWMGKAHARFNLDPATIGVNVAFYGAPQFGFFNLPGGAAGITGGADALVLEAMLDLGLRLDFGAIGFSGAMIMNVADETSGGGGSALRFGLSCSINIGGGFMFIPGLFLTHHLSGVGGVDVNDTNMQIGITFVYNF